MTARTALGRLRPGSYRVLAVATASIAGPSGVALSDERSARAALRVR
jgi:hypothetical protein